VLDLVAMLLKRRPHYVRLAGDPGSAEAMTADDSLPGYAAIAGPSFVNRMAAREFFVYPFNRPLTRAKRLRYAGAPHPEQDSFRRMWTGVSQPVEPWSMHLVWIDG
jgi:hypothetical protein